MKLAILCSGQAGQYARMLDELLAEPDFAELRAIAGEIIGQDVGEWWHTLDESEIFANANAQFAIALFQIAAWARLQPVLPVAPVVAAGYSLGEVLAWHVTGVLDVKTTLTLVRTRALLMDCLSPAANDACMVLWRGRSTPAMRMARSRAMSEHRLTVAIYRPGGDLVLGGSSDAVEAFMSDPAVGDADLVRLQVKVPSHTPWLRAAVEPFREKLANSEALNPAMPVLAGVDGLLLRSWQDAVQFLPRQLAEPVHWDWCQESLISLGVDVAIELGPGNDLSKLLEGGQQGIAARSCAEFARFADITDWLKAHA